MQERIKEHDRHIRLALPAVSGHQNTEHHPLWIEVGDFTAHWYTRSEEAIHIILLPDNINRDKFKESKFLKRGYQRSKTQKVQVCQRAAEGTTSNQTSQEVTMRIKANQSQPSSELIR